MAKEFIIIIYIFLLTIIISILAGNIASKNYDGDSSCACIEETPAALHTGITSSLCGMCMALLIGYKNPMIAIGLVVFTLVLGAVAAFGVLGLDDRDLFVPSVLFGDMKICDDEVKCTTKETHGWNWGLAVGCSITIVSSAIILYFFPADKIKKFIRPPPQPTTLI